MKAVSNSVDPRLKRKALTNATKIAVPDSQLQYFGFYGSAFRRDFSNDLKGFTNALWVRGSVKKIAEGVKSAKRAKMDCVLFTRNLLFDTRDDWYALAEDRETKLASLKKEIKRLGMLKRVAMIYIADEPFVNLDARNSRFTEEEVVEQLEEATRSVKKVFGPDVVTGIVYYVEHFYKSYWKVPASLDIVGYFCYDSIYKGCEDQEKTIYEYIGFLQKNIFPHQKLMFIPPTWEGAEIDEFTMHDELNVYYDITLHEPRFFAMFPFIWEDLDGERGARSISRLRKLSEKIGTQILSRRFKDPLKTLSDVHKVRGTINMRDNKSKNLKGWAYDPDAPHRMLEIDVYIDGKKKKHLMETIITNHHRQGINEKNNIVGYHGFQYKIPKRYRDGKKHKIYFFAKDLSLTYLRSTPKDDDHYVLLPVHKGRRRNFRIGR